MNILLDGEIFSRQRYGGISRYFAELAKGFLRRRHDVSVLCPLCVNSYIDNVPGLNLQGLRIPVFNKTNRARVTASRFISHFAGYKGYDIVHETYYDLMDHRKAAPVVTTVHDMIYETTNESFDDRDYLVAAKKKSLARADAIICVSNTTKELLGNVYPEFLDKSHVVYHGVSIASSGAVGNAPERGRPYFLYVGLREGYKNFNTVLDAMRILCSRGVETDLLLFGGPQISLAENYRIAAMAIPQDRIKRITGDDALLAKLYTGAIAYICSSMHEGFGLPIIEAMSCGCPVLCAEASCLPEIAQEAAVYFDPNSSESLAVQMGNLTEMANSDRNVLIERCKIRAADFSWDSCVDKTERIYQGLVVR